jgi:hypothetical protein
MSFLCPSRSYFPQVLCLATFALLTTVSAQSAMASFGSKPNGEAADRQPVCVRGYPDVCFHGATTAVDEFDAITGRLVGKTRSQDRHVNYLSRFVQLLALSSLEEKWNVDGARSTVAATREFSGPHTVASEKWESTEFDGARSISTIEGEYDYSRQTGRRHSENKFFEKNGQLSVWNTETNVERWNDDERYYQSTQLDFDVATGQPGAAETSGFAYAYDARGYVKSMRSFEPRPEDGFALENYFDGRGRLERSVVTYQNDGSRFVSRVDWDSNALHREYIDAAGQTSDIGWIEYWGMRPEVPERYDSAPCDVYDVTVLARCLFVISTPTPFDVWKVLTRNRLLEGQGGSFERGIMQWYQNFRAARHVNRSSGEVTSFRHHGCEQEGHAMRCTMEHTVNDAGGLEIRRAEVVEIFSARKGGSWHVERTANVVAKGEEPKGSRVELHLNTRQQVEHSRIEVLEGGKVSSVTERTTQFDASGVLPLTDVKTFNGKVVARRVRTYH